MSKGQKPVFTVDPEICQSSPHSADLPPGSVQVLTVKDRFQLHAFIGQVSRMQEKTVSLNLLYLHHPLRILAFAPSVPGVHHVKGPDPLTVSLQDSDLFVGEIFSFAAVADSCFSFQAEQREFILSVRPVHRPDGDPGLQVGAPQVSSSQHFKAILEEMDRSPSRTALQGRFPFS